MKRALRKPLTAAQAKVRPFTVYLPEELDQWLRDQAHEYGRTLTSQTVRILQAGRRTVQEKNEQVA